MRFFQNIGDLFYKTVIYDDRYKYILEGFFNTIIIAFFAVIIGVIIGTIVALIRNNYDQNQKFKLLNHLCKLYVSIIRGTPVILQLMIIYYVIFKSVNIDIIIVSIIAFGINSGAYVSEIIRAGINSIPQGQSEAGYSLGLKYAQIMQHIVLPQAIKNVLPALGNEFITLLKETSVGAYIGVVELTKASDIIASRTYDYFFPLLIIAIIYLTMTIGLSKLITKLEGKLKNARS
jgi:His/Glu/Gln/Arg/opine family amino acid ABC transporter permease subunit